MPRDRSPKRSSTSEDSEWMMQRCPVCDEEYPQGKMWRCAQCRKLVCEDCGLIPRGCGKDDYSKICLRCKTTVFKGKHKYCTEQDCDDCDNKSPRFRKALERKGDQYETFRQQFKPEVWKKTHQAINYVSRYRGKWLADIIMSGDSFERGYIDWLIRQDGQPPPPDQTDAQNRNFAKFVAEAHELKQLILNTKLVQRNLRKLAD
jgi:hypothetical protein